MNRKPIWAALMAALTLAALTIMASPASAHTHFVVDGKWNSYRMVVADRTGYDYNEYEAVVAWNNVGPGSAIWWGVYQTADCNPASATARCVRITTVHDYQMPSGYSEAAATAVTWRIDGTKITGCEIKVNHEVVGPHPSPQWRQAIITHELGHCLGFKHAPSPEYWACRSIMAAEGRNEPWSDSPQCYRPTTNDQYEFNYHY